MKVGVISDTHGNIGGFLDAFDLLRTEHEVAKLFFLGHDYKDMDRVIEIKRALRAAKRKDEDPTDFVSDLYDVLAKQEGLHSVKTRDKLEDTEWLKKHTIRVPGDDEDEALFGDEINDKEFELVGGRIVCAVHNPKTLSKEDIASATIIIYGHSHLYQVDKAGSRFFCNPGHLMADVDQGRKPTYGVLDMGESPRFQVFDLDGNVVLDKPLELETKRKFSAS